MTLEAAALPDQAKPDAPLQFSWLQPMVLIGLSVYNFFMRILTLGAYHFWGKTEVRKRIWSAVRIEGEPLEYTGTGRELLRGFLVVFIAVLLPASLLSFAAAAYFGPNSIGYSVFSLLSYGLIFFLIGIGTHRAQRYRLSRTRWRGIRGTVDGSSLKYGFAHLWTALLIPPTFGWIIPWRSMYLQRILTNDTRFGDRAFSFEGSAARLYKRFAVLWAGVASIVVTVILVGGALMGPVFRNPRALDAQSSEFWWLMAAIYLAIAIGFLIYAVLSAWYRAGQIRHFARSTRFNGAPFRSTVTAPGLVKLAFGNFFITMLSLGMLSPIAQARTARYLVENLGMESHVEPEAIKPGSYQHTTTGEGLAQAFDVDAF